jgi:thiosulfate dehydrogenase [quinone] large subunit
MANSVSTAQAPERAIKNPVADPNSVGSDRAWAYTILRLTFGFNILLHGLSRIFAGHAAFLAYLNHYFEKAPLVPASLLPLFARVLPPVETALGILLVLGLWTRFALIAGGLVITLLAIGTNLAQDWNVAGLQLIYAFFYYYLLVHRDLNSLSVDGVMSR